MDSMTETIPVFDGMAWRNVTVPVTAAPARRTQAGRRTVRHGAPRSLAGLSSGSPFAESMTDTAFSDSRGASDGFADMRRLSGKPATMATHRPATVVPAGQASQATAGTLWHDLGADRKR